jgi:hypothetical protein
MARNHRKSSTTASKPQTTHPAENVIRQRAHEIWLRNGCLEGHDMDNWLEAERELQAKAPATTSSASA